MKQLFVFAFLLSSCCLFSQDYKPMAVEGATWVYASYYYSNATYCGHQIKGDSTINGTDYKVVYSLNIARNENDSISYELITDYPLGFLRDDIQEKKVYIIYTDFAPIPEMINCIDYVQDTVQEYMLYDFDIEIGEFVTGCDEDNGAPLREINSVDIFGFEVLAYEFDGFPSTIFEQIGSLKGFFKFDQVIAATWTELLTFCINDEPGCPYYLGPLSSEDITKNDQVKVFPNPSNSYFHIESEEDRIQTISIYTLTGQRVYSLSEINNTTVDIDVSDLSVSGNLFAIIELEDGKLTRKHLVVE